MRDQAYLLNTQYKDATNFAARVELHRRFSVNKSGFQRWVFDHFTLAEGSAQLIGVTRESFTDVIRQELSGRGMTHLTNTCGIFEAARL